MSKATSGNQQDNNDYQAEINRLKKEIDGLRSKSKMASLEAEIEDLKKQKVNAQISQQHSLTNIPGYDEEFARLKEDAIKQIRKNKKDKIVSSLIALVSIPISAVVVYVILVITNFSSFLELDQNNTQIMYVIIAVVFIWLEIKAILELIKTIFINPEVIPDQTLSYLSLTAKEHALDPKGSVIREKYGTEKWTSVTQT